MTLIECFAESPLANVIGGIILKPEKIIFAGNSAEMGKEINKYQSFFRSRGISASIMPLNVDPRDFDMTVKRLEDIITSEDECVFDVTGGDNRIIMAFGAVYERYKNERKISVRSFDYNKDIKNGSISVKELIELNGGIIHPDTIAISPRYNAEHISNFWDYICRQPKLWNKTIKVLNEFEKQIDGRNINLDMGKLKDRIADYEEKDVIYKKALIDFEKHGFIKNLSLSAPRRYIYTDEISRYCTKKAGNILELKCYFEARDMVLGGKRYFNDCLMGVNIDWDGIINKKGYWDTKNEIDVIAIHGMIPLFISCKNGNILEEEFYKLNTVADRFGGGFSRKMLIATDFEPRSSAAMEAMLQRAKEMNIYFVVDAAQLDKKGWQNAFRRATEMDY